MVETRCLDPKACYRNCFLPPSPWMETTPGQAWLGGWGHAGNAKDVWVICSEGGKEAVCLCVPQAERVGSVGPIVAVGSGVPEYFKSDSASSTSVFITPKEIFKGEETLPVIQHLAITLQTISPPCCFQAQLSGAGPRLRAGTRDASGQSVRGAGDEKAEPPWSPATNSACPFPKGGPGT